MLTPIGQRHMLDGKISHVCQCRESAQCHEGTKNMWR